MVCFHWHPLTLSSRRATRVAQLASTPSLDFYSPLVASSLGRHARCDLMESYAAGDAVETADRRWLGLRLRAAALTGSGSGDLGLVRMSPGGRCAACPLARPRLWRRKSCGEPQPTPPC